MTTAAEAAAAPTSVRLGGKDFKAHPLDLEDYGKWDEWAKSAHLAAASIAASSLKPVDRAGCMRDANDAAMRICFGSPKGIGAMLAINGRALLIALSLQHAPEQRGLTPDAVWKAVCDPAGRPNWTEFNDAFGRVLQVSGFGAGEDDSADPQTAAMRVLDLLS